MLKEMTLLVIVLWGSQGMPTTPPAQQSLRGLTELYCKAEALLQDYKSVASLLDEFPSFCPAFWCLENKVDKKHLSSEARSKMETEFSQASCNFTKLAEECQIICEFKELFVWLKDMHQQDGLLKPVMGSFTLLIELQNNYANHTCSERPSDKAPEFNCPKYSEEDEEPSRENMFHYIFELYKTLMHKLLSSKLKLEQDNSIEVCKAKGD